VRFPDDRASWVSDPIGLASPRLIASSPAMNVVVTAPMQDENSQLAFRGAIWTLLELGKMRSPLSKCYNTNSMRERATATLSTIVVDDEQLACDEISYLLKDFPEVDVIATVPTDWKPWIWSAKWSRTWFFWTSICRAGRPGCSRQLRERA